MGTKKKAPLLQSSPTLHITERGLERPFNPESPFALKKNVTIASAAAKHTKRNTQASTPKKLISRKILQQNCLEV